MHQVARQGWIIAAATQDSEVGALRADGTLTAIYSEGHFRGHSGQAAQEARRRSYLYERRYGRELIRAAALRDGEVLGADGVVRPGRLG